MIVEIPDDTSIVKWKKNDNDEWKSAEISDLIKAYEKRQQGEWIKVKADRMSIDMSGEIVTGYKCSICGRYIVTLPSKLVDYPFCHCGAEMKGGAK